MIAKSLLSKKMGKEFQKKKNLKIFSGNVCML
jgi:hypothetical protein